MAQTTFDDDELFGEAADEARAEVREHLRNARATLPTADAVWETDADNVLGALNGLRSALDTGEATDELRQAKKRYVMAERAGAFEDDEELAQDIESVADLVGTIEDAHEQVGELTSTVPGLRSQLEEAHDEGAAAADEADGEEAEA